MANFIVQTIYNPSINAFLFRNLKVLFVGQVIGILVKGTEGGSH